MVGRSLGERGGRARAPDAPGPRALRAGRRARCSSTARSSATPSRSPTPRATPAEYGLDDIAPFIEYGASPRGPIGLVQAARALALLRGRGHVTVDDVRDLAPDVLRHRIVLSYDALSEGVSADDLLEQVLGAVTEPPADTSRRTGGARVTQRGRSSRPPARQGPGADAAGADRRARPVVARRVAGALPGDRRAAGIGAGTELAQLRPYEVGDDVRHIDAAATARTGEPHVRLHVPERTLTTWLVLDVSPSMAFGTALRLKADVAEGAALVIGGLAIRRAGASRSSASAPARRALLPRAAPARAWSRCGARWTTASRRTAQHPIRSRHALVRVGKIARQPASSR